MSSFFGIHNPFSGYGPQYRVGDTIPGAAQQIGGFSRGGIGPAVGGGTMGGQLGSMVAARMGLGGLSGVSDGFGDALSPRPRGITLPQQLPGEGGPAAGGMAPPDDYGSGDGGGGSFLGRHGDSLIKGFGGALQGGAAIYSAIQSNATERRRLKDEEDAAERKRKDQEAAAAAVGPGYAQILLRMMGGG